MPRWLPALALPLALATFTAAQKPADADQAAARVQVEKGLRVETWAAEPLLANPVCFAFDERGRCFVVETHRLHAGVTDTRNHMYWLDDDLAIRSVADRLAMYQKHKYPPSPEAGEQLRILWDSSGAGKADKSEVFAGPFNKPEDGLAAGVLARKGDVYFACIPSLYKFRGDTKATETRVLSTGYGLHVQFIGHDMHGLVMGPDGKLYFSIGDRGLNVTTKEGKKLFNPDSGAVLRCDPDGANLEIVHVGLRNPQELAFDDLGNLFTYDNNSDSGDKARWVQIVEGGDSGWRCGYQYGTLMHHTGVPQGNRGPWNAEKIWHVPGPDGGPPAYVVPPLANFGNGPSGLCFYPGVGLSDRYKGHFFACDFTSTRGTSVIWSLALKPKGASFEVTDLHPFVKNMVPTDCDFGPDGAFYWSDWLQGWGLPRKGRIFRLTDPEAMKHPAVAESKKLLAEGFAKKSVAELAKLLEHPHRRVRQEAQFELAARKPAEAVAAFAKAAKESKDRFARLHAVWGLGMVGRYDLEKSLKALIPLADDADAEVRLNAAKTLGRLIPRHIGGTPTFEFWNLVGSGRGAIEKLVSDRDARVRAAAIVANATVGPMQMTITPMSQRWQFVPPLELLLSDNDADPYLRHAAVEALVRSVDNPGDLTAAWKTAGAKYDTPAVRLGVALALRRLGDPKLGDFLADPEPKVAAEAARAIYDQDLAKPMPELAKLAEKPNMQEPVAYRALAANYKLGGPEHAARVAAFAARATEPAHLREFALKLLADWARPARRDPIMGTTQSLEPRDPAVVAAAVRPVLPKLFAGSDAVRREAVRLVAKLGIADVGPLMAAIVTDAKQPAGLRADALFALEAVKAKELADAAKAALGSPEPKLRAAARVVAAKANPAAAATELAALVRDEKASVIERQTALDVMGTLKESKEVDAALAEQLDALAAGKIPAELKLDVLESAQARANAKNLTLHAPLREKLKALDAAARAAAEKDPLARSRDTLAGGDAEKGRAIVLNSAAVYCQRCHKFDGQGGEVGPPLNGIGAKQTREYLLESIVYPSAKIAEGYQSVILQTVDGKTITGVLRAKDAEGYTVVTADNKVVTVPKDDVESEKPDKSAMPDDLHTKLSKRELRDVVEFLASLKDEPKK